MSISGTVNPILRTLEMFIPVFMLRRSNEAYRTGNVGREGGREVFKKNSNMISVTSYDVAGYCTT